MTDKEPRSLALQLKELGQALGIRNRTLRYVTENKLVPGLKIAQSMPRELTSEEATLVALAAILYDHGIEGNAAVEIVRKAVPQIREGKSTVCVDFRGSFPIQVRISIEVLLKRICR